MESAVAVVDRGAVVSAGIVPSYTVGIGGGEWVISGLCIMDREKTLDGVFLKESYFMTDRPDLAVNVNTQRELELARRLC
jgi:GTP:adenosylcobinamide-phosphate guanylyltransferase